MEDVSDALEILELEQELHDLANRPKPKPKFEVKEHKPAPAPRRRRR